MDSLTTCISNKKKGKQAVADHSSPCRIGVQGGLTDTQGHLSPVGQTAKAQAGHLYRMLPTFNTPKADPSTDAPEPRTVWANRVSPGGRRTQVILEESEAHPREMCGLESRETRECVCPGDRKEKSTGCPENCVWI